MYLFLIVNIVKLTGQKTKKWKSMYFVLNDTEQQLYYFENQKVAFSVGNNFCFMSCFIISICEM